MKNVCSTFNALLSVNLNQINFVTNSLERMLDLVFVDNEIKANFNVAEVPMLNNSYHHQALEIKLSFLDYNGLNFSNTKYKSKRNFAKPGLYCAK